MPAKILLVDDNLELLTLLARLVEAEGWIAVTAPKGKTAIDLIPKERPHAAVVDVLLPDMMGYDVAHALKAANVPFVFVTGVFKGGRAASDARAQHGAAAYFEKPFDAKKLIETLRGLLPNLTPAPTKGSFAQGGGDEEESIELSDFDVEEGVETDEPMEGMDLTGRVTISEGGKVSAVLRGDTVRAAPVGAPARPKPAPAPTPAPGPPRSASAPRPPSRSRPRSPPRRRRGCPTPRESSRTTSRSSSPRSGSRSRPASSPCRRGR